MSKVISEKRLFLTLERTSLLIREKINRKLKNRKAGITFDQSLILEEIHDRPGLTQVEVSKKLSKDPGSVSRILKTLVRKRFVTKKPSVKNLRENKLYLTAEGYELIEQIIKNNKKIYQDIFNQAHVREQNLIIEVLKRIQ